MSDGAMKLVAWLLVTAAAGLAGSTHAGGAAPEERPADLSAAPPWNDVNIDVAEIGYLPSQESPPSPAGARCPAACEECAPAAGWFQCGGQKAQYSDTGLGLDCGGLTLNCSAVPLAPGGGAAAAGRVTLRSAAAAACRLPPAAPLACLARGADWAPGGVRLEITDAAGAPTAENLRGLDVRDLTLKYPSDPAARGPLPTAALAACPALASLTVWRFARGALRPGALAAPALRRLELGAADVGALPPGAFRGLPGLRVLTTFTTNITEIPDGAFEGLDSLETLYMSRVPLVNVSERAFRHLPRLRTLQLRDTGLRRLSGGLLHNLTKLEDVKIECRRSLELDARSLAGLPALLSVTIKGAVTSLPGDLFLGSSALVNLTLAGNSLSSLEGATFDPLWRLQRLDLSGNQLAGLPPRVFSNLTALARLDLSGNRIQAVGREALAGLRALAWLSLARNELAALDYLWLAPARALRHLSLSHNRLAWEPGRPPYDDPFSYVERALQTLDLSHNRLGAVYSALRLRALGLKLLDLAHNNITALTAADEQFLGAAEVDLRNNSIRHATAHQDDGAARLRLGGNPFHCDCTLAAFLTQAQSPADSRFDLSGAACAGPAELRGRALSGVPPLALACDLLAVRADMCGQLRARCDAGAGADCGAYGRACAPLPARVRCRLRGDAAGADNRAECEADTTQVPNITAMNELLRVNISGLALRLARAPDGPLPAFVRALDLSGVRLRAVPAVPGSVRRLHLARTGLREIPDSVWTQHNYTVYLAGNPLDCNCSSAERVRALQDHRTRIADYELISCADDSLVAQKDVGALCDVLRATVASALLASALILLAAAAALVVRHRALLAVLLHSRRCCRRLLPRGAPDRARPYDVFLSFADEDAKFVLHELLPRLEPRYRLLVQDRDWTVGGTIPAEIHRSVGEARCTLILLTENYVKWRWAPEVCRAAHVAATAARRRRALLVCKDFPLERLDRDTRTLLSLAGRLKHDERFFWEKLYYALPRLAPHPAAPRTGSTSSADTHTTDILSDDQDTGYKNNNISIISSFKPYEKHGAPDAVRGLDVVLDKNGQLYNKGFVKDV